MRGQAFLAASAMAAALFAAGPASAQNYGNYHDEHVARQEQCQQSKNNRTAGGAAIGAVAGAVLGSQAAARGHRSDGSVLGAVVGGLAGAMIGRQSARCEDVDQTAYDPYTGEAHNQYGQNDPYADRDYRDDGDLYGGPYGDDRGYRDGRANDRRYGRNDDCRMGEIITRDRRGRERREEAWMCRDSSGRWRPA